MDWASLLSARRNRRLLTVCGPRKSDALELDPAWDTLASDGPQRAVSAIARIGKMNPHLPAIE